MNSFNMHQNPITHRRRCLPDYGCDAWQGKTGVELLYTHQAGSSPLLFLLIGCLLLSACKPGVLTEESLQSWVREPEHGLIKTEERGSLQISAVYRPTDLLVAQELADGEATPEDIEKLRSKFGAYRYFILSVSKDGGDALYNTADSYAEFSDNLQKLSFRMPEYLYMTTSAKDTVELLDFHFSRMHGMGGSTQVLLAFDMDKLKDKRWIQLNLKEMGFGTGRVNLRFRMKDLLNTPEIDFLHQVNK
jgi:hypothetical protein